MKRTAETMAHSGGSPREKIDPVQRECRSHQTSSRSGPPRLRTTQFDQPAAPSRCHCSSDQRCAAGPRREEGGRPWLAVTWLSRDGTGLLAVQTDCRRRATGRAFGRSDCYGLRPPDEHRPAVFALDERQAPLDQRTHVRQGPGHFTAEVSTLSGQPALVDAPGPRVAPDPSLPSLSRRTRTRSQHRPHTARTLADT